MKLKDVTLVEYTKKEEIINCLSHALGLVLSALIVVTCVVPSVKSGDFLRMVCSFLYFAGTTLMFAGSVMYHAVPPGSKKSVLRLLDHCMIFFAVAGTATGCVPAVYDTVGIIQSVLMVAAAWTGAFAGLIFTLASFEKTKAARMTTYILTALICAVCGSKAYTVLPDGAFYSFLCGSLLLIAGVIIYGLGRKRRYFHCVFHFFILGGLIVYYLGISTYCY